MQCQILLVIHKWNKEIWSENLVIYQKSLKAFLQAPLQFSAFTWHHCSHVGVQNYSKKILLGIWFYYYAKLERHFAIVLYTNMVVSSRKWKPRIIITNRFGCWNSMGGMDLSILRLLFALVWICDFSKKNNNLWYVLKASPVRPDLLRSDYCTLFILLLFGITWA